MPNERVKLSGPTSCSPGKKCGLLRMIMDLTKGYAGLSDFFTLTGGSGVVYRPAPRSKSYIIRYCPFCGKCPNKEGKPKKEKKDEGSVSNARSSNARTKKASARRSPVRPGVAQQRG